MSDPRSHNFYWRRRRHQYGASAGDPIYLLRDLFASGAVSVGTRTAVVGSETIIDSGTKLSISAASSARLFASGGSGTWDDPSLWSALDGATFGAVAAIVRVSGAGDEGPALILHSAANVSPVAAGMGLWFDFPQFAPAVATQYVSNPTTRARSIDYMLIVVKRAGGGAIVGLCGGVYGTFPAMTPLWIYDTGTITTTAYVGLTERAGAWRVSNLSAVKSTYLSAGLLTRYGAALVADTFTRANGNLAGSSVETGGLTWATPSGTPTITSGALTTGTGEVRPYVLPASAPTIIEVTVNTAASGNIWAAVMFRFSSANQNFIMFRLEKTVWKLEERSGAAGGTSNVVVQSAFATNNAQSYRLRIIDYGTRVRMFIDNAEQNVGGALTSHNAGNFGVGVTRASAADPNGSTFSAFAAWGPTITVPTELGPFAAAPVGTGAALSTDTFTAADGTAIATYDAAFSTTGAGTWEINSNKARITAAATAGYAHRNSGVTDMEVTCAVTLPSTTGNYPLTPFNDWFCGVVARFTDTNNYLIARYLYQADSPEIEIFEMSGGVGTLCAFVNFGAGALATSSTHTIKLAVVGREVAAYHDGELVAQGYTSLTTGTRAGIGVDAPAAGQPSFDNLVIKAAI